MSGETKAIERSHWILRVESPKRPNDHYGQAGPTSSNTSLTQVFQQHIRHGFDADDQTLFIHIEIGQMGNRENTAL